MIALLLALVLAPPDSVRDDFNRPDGPLALPWNDPSVACCSTPVAGVALSGGAARVPGPASLGWASYPRLLQPMQYVHATVRTPLGTIPTKTALILRGHTGGSRIEVRFGPAVASVVAQTDGVWLAPAAAATVGISSGDKIAATVDSFGTVTAFKNGLAVLTAKLPTWKYVASGGVVGFSGTAGMIVDDFGFGTWHTGAAQPPPPPPPPPPTNHPPVPVINGFMTGFAFSADSSSDADGDSLTYAWDFGDSSAAVGDTVGHVYPGAGSYTVTLTVSDGHDTTSTSTVVGISITASAPPPPPPPTTLVVGFYFHVPAVNDSTSDCITLRPGPAQSDTVWAHWRVSPLGIEDSLAQRRGALVAKAYPTTIATPHTVTAWISRWGRLGGAPKYLRGCDSPAVVVTPR